MTISKSNYPVFIPAAPLPVLSKRGTSHSHRFPCAVANSSPDSVPDQPLSVKRQGLERQLRLTLAPSSDSSGQCTCIWCSGTKERRCSWCNGHGHRFEATFPSWEQLSDDIQRMNTKSEQQPFELPESVPVVCSACSGTKKLRCGYCHGSGIGSYGHAF